MSAEDFREAVSNALAAEAGAGTDPDDLQAVLDDMSARVDAIRAVRGEA